MMKQRIKQLLSDFDSKTLMFSTVSFVITAVFAVYNGFLGLQLYSLWHGSICIYYILLTILRAALVISDRILSHSNVNSGRRIVFLITHIFLILLNISLVVPIALMVKFERPVDMKLIPAIAVAAYTTYKIIIASVNLKKKSGSTNILVKELRTIGFTDALLSVITLQNTLIMVAGDADNKNMLVLCAVTSGAILILMITLSLISLVSTRNNKKD